MNYYSVPADFKKETIDKYCLLDNQYPNSRVIETYGNITIGFNLGSGRLVNTLPEIDLTSLKQYVKYSKSKNINFNYTLNASTMHNKEFTKEGISEIILFLKMLKDIGIDSLTISLPSVIEIVKSSGLDFKIKASAICQITNANIAQEYKSMGCERIVVEESVYRNFTTLKRIKESIGDNVELIVNAFCFIDCPVRRFHYDQTTDDSIQISSEESTNYYYHRCILRRNKEIRNMIKMAWIRPEDIKYYRDIGINNFKIQGRQLTKEGDIARVVESYFQESFDGDLMDLLMVFAPATNFRVRIDNKKLDGFLNPFIENPNHCKLNCNTCNYCESFAVKAIDEEEYTKVTELSNDFYKGYDPFSNLLNRTNKLDEVLDNTQEFEANFDL
jgi:collagenase-like PrtC family protease